MRHTAKNERDEAIERLRGWLKPGTTLYTTLRSVSRSGMSRCIALHFIGENSEMFQATTNAATALGWRYDSKRDGIIVTGCGMDMGFHLVYTLSRTLFPNGFSVNAAVYRGFCERDPCTCHDDSAWTETRGEDGRVISRTYPKGCDCGCAWSYSGRNGDRSGWDTDGGYALTSRWI